MINNLIAYWSTSYIRDLTVSVSSTDRDKLNQHWDCGKDKQLQPRETKGCNYALPPMVV